MGQPVESLEYRPALPADRLVAARLIALSMGRMGVALFGLGNNDVQLEAVGKFYLGMDTWMSHRWCELACVAGRPAGLLLSFAGREIDRLNFAVFRHLWGVYGVSGALRFVTLIVRYIGYKECEAHQYYVSNLAVLPEMEGQGIGAALLARAEQKTLASGLKECALVVEIDNERAQSLYRRAGYRQLEVVRTPKLTNVLGTAGFIRMAKQVP